MQDQCPCVLVLFFLILCFHGLTHLRPIKLPAPPASETLLSLTGLWDFCALGVFTEEIETTGDSFLKFGLAIKISVLGGSIP